MPVDPAHETPPDRPARRPPQRGNKIAQIVAATLVEDIVREGLQPGDRLAAEAAMLERFQFGRASIREGLRLLETYGVVTIRPGQNGGPIVASLDADDLARTLSLFLRIGGATYRSVIEARLIIEPVMARLAAERRDPEHLAELRAAMEREEQADLADYATVATGFHYTVSGGSGNPVLDLLGRTLRLLYAERLTGSGLVPQEARPEIRKVHREIGEAIIAGDADTAERLMKDHMAHLAALQDERTPWVMDERVSWDL